MNDEQFASFLMFVTQQLAELRKPHSNAGPRAHEMNTYSIEDEGFSRWMGWRGQDEQEREMAWPDLKAERLERSRRELWKENQELRGLLRFIRAEIAKRVPQDGT